MKLSCVNKEMCPEQLVLLIPLGYEPFWGVFQERQHVCPHLREPYFLFLSLWKSSLEKA